MRTAFDRTDEDGIESLSMRKLAQELGVEAMSLYRHVRNKGEIVDGMIDLVFGEIGLPHTDVDWKTAMRERAISAREVLARHPWAIGLMESRSTPGPATLQHHDAVIGCLLEAGLLDPDGRARVLGPGQLHLRLRPAAGELAVQGPG